MCTGVDHLIIDEVLMVSSGSLQSIGIILSQSTSLSGEMSIVLGGDMAQLPPPVQPHLSAYVTPPDESLLANYNGPLLRHNQSKEVQRHDADEEGILTGRWLQDDKLRIGTTSLLRGCLLPQSCTLKEVCYCLIHVVLLIIHLSLVKFMPTVTRWLCTPRNRLNSLTGVLLVCSSTTRLSKRRMKGRKNRMRKGRVSIKLH